MHKLYYILLCLTFLSCGSGTFIDDPDTWNKVFGEETPNEIEVLNSRFWKSGHWTYEFELFAKLQSEKDFIKEYFIDKYSLSQYEIHATVYLEDIPNWFVEKSNSKNYEVWKGGPNSITLYVHKNKNITYLHVLQL
ncbi:MAG: hypothetical protein AAF901_02785 [Bacteroidota bacterium]